MMKEIRPSFLPRHLTRSTPSWASSFTYTTPTASQLLAALDNASGPNLAHFLGLFAEVAWLSPPVDIVQAVVRSPVLLLDAGSLPAAVDGSSSSRRNSGAAIAAASAMVLPTTRTWRVMIEDRRHGLNDVGIGHHPHGPGFIVGALQAFAESGALGIRSVTPIDDEEYIGSCTSQQQVLPSISNSCLPEWASAQIQPPCCPFLVCRAITVNPVRTALTAATSAEKATTW